MEIIVIHISDITIIIIYNYNVLYCKSSSDLNSKGHSWKESVFYQYL